MGGGKGGGGTNTVTQSSAPPPEILQAYQDVLAQAKNVSGQPLNLYGGPSVAGFTPTQQAGIDTINQSQGIANPYINQASQYANNSTQSLWGQVPQFDQSQINKYTDPYQQNVINATMGNIQENNAQQQQALQGNAISKGAWGGDRAGIAAAELARQQDLASNQTLAGLQSQGYSQALGAFQQQQAQQLGAAQSNAQLSANAANTFGNLGNEAQQTTLQGAGAQLQAGGLQQQLAQSLLNVPYQQFLQSQQYPFQSTQYLANIAEGIGGQSGQTGTTTQPSPSGLSQGLGTAASLGSLGYLGYLALSDKRVKTDIKRIGNYKGYPLYTFKYKGTDTPQMGVMAQDVEKKNPSAVSEISGIKAVDYAKLNSGGVARYASGGIAGIPDLSISIVPLGQAPMTHSLAPAPAPVSQNSQDTGSQIGGLASIYKAAKADKADVASKMGNEQISPGLAAADPSLTNPVMAMPDSDFTSFLDNMAFADGGDVPDDSDYYQQTLDSIDTVNPSMGGSSESIPTNTGLSQGDYLDPKETAALSVLAGGLGTMAGTSPFAAANIGQGGLQGLQFYQKLRQDQLNQRRADVQAQRLAEQAAHWNRQLELAKLKPYTRPDGTRGVMNVETGEEVNGPTSGVPAQGLPPKVLDIFSKNNITPELGMLDKTEVKQNADEYSQAVNMNDAARNAAATASKVRSALKNYQAGSGATAMAAVNAALPEGWQSEALQNTQYINKVSGQLAGDLASKLKGARIGVGMERFLKSTTIDTANAPDVNEKIVSNIEQMPLVTRQIKDMQAYLKKYPTQQRSAVIDSFFDENPIMLPAGEGDVDSINPAYNNQQLFQDWLSGKQGASAPPAASADESAQAIAAAKDAIAKGKDPAAVKKRLEEHGIDTSGL